MQIAGNVAANAETAGKTYDLCEVIGASLVAALAPGAGSSDVFEGMETSSYGLLAIVFETFASYARLFIPTGLSLPLVECFQGLCAAVTSCFGDRVQRFLSAANPRAEAQMSEDEDGTDSVLHRHIQYLQVFYSGGLCIRQV